ncbi:MAG: 4-demethylwyosine synthase TYW1 [Nanoarchaeota archaeon]
MLSLEIRKDLEKQQYRIVGDHSAVKICGWTRRMIQGRGGCYKLKFYGIMSSQCMQMTTCMSCANRCLICWRDYKAPVSKEWQGDIDDPASILEGSIAAHHKLLIGFKGSKTADKKAYQASQEVRHVALSLTGEPIIYPRLNELLAHFNQRGISTFVVTNGQYPEAIRSLAPVTQLYLSLDAADRESLKRIDLPLFPDYWERLNRSLDYLAQKEQRTCIRVTLTKGLTMDNPEDYAALIKKGDPDFIEIKAYMHVGASRQRLKKENMPTHEEVKAFVKQLSLLLPDWEAADDHVPSRVVMLAKKTFKKQGIWHTWIDFGKWHDRAISVEPFSSEEYSRKTPDGQKGLIDEKTKELTFWKP